MNSTNTVKFNKSLFNFIAFGCLGITTEIVFTALQKTIGEYTNFNTLTLSLQGKSYVWMFFIYGLGAILFKYCYFYVKNYHLLVRLLIYAIIIFSVEFITGFILDKTTGSCPWYYEEGLTIMGYIRLDYIFFWMGFGYVLEKVYLFLDRIEFNNGNINPA